MNLIFSYLAAHLLSAIESAIAANEPEIVALIEQEIKLIIGKLETYLTKKSGPVGAIVTPVLNEVGMLATGAVSAAGASVASNVQAVA